MKCLQCRDRGMIGGCPACGAVVDNIVLEAPVVTEKIKANVDIPEFYKGNIWSKQTFLNSHKDSLAVSTLERYAELLTRIYNIFSSGKIPGKSFMIYASNGMGKLTWAYSCMQEAIKYGYSVMPIIDNTQYKRLNIISSDRISSKYLKQFPYSIDEYNNADVVFISIDPDNFQGSFRTVESLLSKRARLGKQTFILSRYSTAQMSTLDYDNTFDNTLAVQPGRDRNKYLEVIGG